MKIHHTFSFGGIDSPHEETGGIKSNYASDKGIQTLRVPPSLFEMTPSLYQLGEQKLSQATDQPPPKHSEENVAKTDEREILLYLVRHGNAEQNTMKTVALNDTMEDTRTLDDECLRNANLSERSRREARWTNKALSNIVNLEPPGRILVGPLTRTLETARIVFPHSNCAIREELSEPKIGLPPRRSSSVSPLELRISFQRYREYEAKEEFAWNSGTALEETVFPSCEETPFRRKRHYRSSEGRDFRFVRRHLQPACEENKEELRKRTERLLFGMLKETNHTSVAVVADKGYLRELERGPLGQGDDARDFQTCEFRVYRVKMSTTDHRFTSAETLAHTERLR